MCINIGYATKQVHFITLKNKLRRVRRSFIMVVAIEEVRCLVWLKRYYLLTKHLLNVDKFFYSPNQRQKIFL